MRSHACVLNTGRAEVSFVGWIKQILLGVLSARVPVNQQGRPRH